MKILIAVADYPSKEKIAMMYVHTRNLYFRPAPFQVKKFAAQSDR